METREELIERLDRLHEQVWLICKVEKNHFDDFNRRLDKLEKQVAAKGEYNE